MRARALVMAASVAVLQVPTGGTATAVCAYDSDDPPLRFKQMIRRGETGDEHFRQLLLGRVQRIRDVGQVGGDLVVRLRVREVAIGPDREIARIEDVGYPPGMAVEDDFAFRRGERYAVVAHLRGSGRFSHDGICGQTDRIARFRLRQLVRMARRS